MGSTFHLRSQPDDESPFSLCPTEQLSVSQPGQLIHLPYPSHIKFEYGLTSLMGDSPTVIIISTGDPITKHTNTIGVDVSPRELLEFFEETSFLSIHDIQKIYIIGEESAIKTAVSKCRSLGIEGEDDIYTYDVQRYPHAFTHEWVYDAHSKMIKIPGFHTKVL